MLAWEESRISDSEHHGPLRYFDYGQFRPMAEQLSQRAGVWGRDAERARTPSGIVGEGIQQLTKRLEASGRAPITDNRVRAACGAVEARAAALGNLVSGGFLVWAMAASSGRVTVSYRIAPDARWGGQPAAEHGPNLLRRSQGLQKAVIEIDGRSRRPLAPARPLPCARISSWSIPTPLMP